LRLAVSWSSLKVVEFLIRVLAKGMTGCVAALIPSHSSVLQILAFVVSGPISAHNQYVSMLSSTRPASALSRTRSLLKKNQKKSSGKQKVKTVFA